MLHFLREWNRARLRARRSGRDADYARWVRRHDTINEAARVDLVHRARRLAHGPRISILMPVFDPDPAFLAEAIASVRAQLYVNWELCIADDASTNERVRAMLAEAATQDARIRVHWRATNGHISVASNAALALASGTFVALMDHDDVLPEHALLCVAEAIVRTPDADVLYSDEDKIDAHGRRHAPHFKCDWNAELLRGHNYLSHLGVYRTALVREVGGFRVGYEGSQDYDLALRCTERSARERIVHIPRVLYHWRSHAGSCASGIAAKPYAVDAGLRALRDHYERIGVAADTGTQGRRYSTQYRLPAPPPSVAVVILDVGSRWALRLAVKRSAGARSVHVLACRARPPGWKDAQWHRSHEGLSPRACNAVVACLDAEIVVVLDSDCRFASFAALQDLFAHALQPGVAAVAPRLVARRRIVGNALVEHDGGLAPLADGWRARSEGAFARAALSQDVAALARGCVVFQRRLFESVRGFDARAADLDAAIVDLTLRMATHGRRNRWVPAVTCDRAGPAQCRTPPIAAEPFSLRAPHSLRTQRT